jgi:pyridoxamine 5'-phosphate oxidase
MSDKIMKTGHIRRDYPQPALHRIDLDKDPFAQFTHWLTEVMEVADVSDPTAMILATVAANGVPHQRTVLLKDHGAEGFTFFTHLDSNKAQQIEGNTRVSLLFPWLTLSRQVIITGRITRTSTATDAYYFSLRPRASQIAAWASHQSKPLANREALEAAYARIEKEFGDDDIPCPPFWGGYSAKAETLEFWQGRPSRLHDRFIYTMENDSWILTRLSP